MDGKPVQTLEGEEATVRAIASFYDFAASVLLDPIPVPGTDLVLALNRQCRLLTDSLVSPASEAGCEEISHWSAMVDGADEEGLGALQRELAADRTRLCRGLNARGPLPPYESYFTDGDAGLDDTEARLKRFYAQGALHRSASVVERADYLGVELAFAASLAFAEAEALAQGRNDAALRDLRERFETEHLESWVAHWCAQAKPAAHTSFFRGFTALLGSLFAEQSF